MLRKDVKPGQIFKYSGSDDFYWVPKEATERPAEAVLTSYATGVDMEADVYDVQWPDSQVPGKTTRTDSTAVALGKAGTVDVPDVGPLRPEQPHYSGLTPEPIDVIEGWALDFPLGNALKYIARAGRKSADKAGDLRKAVTYLERAIAATEGRRAWK